MGFVGAYSADLYCDTPLCVNDGFMGGKSDCCALQLVGHDLHDVIKQLQDLGWKLVRRRDGSTELYCPVCKPPKNPRGTP